MDPKDLIAALAVLADPNASDEDKAAALDKLSAYFNSLLDSQGSETTEAASETAEDTEQASEAGDGEKDEKKDEPSKEMASALATVKALEARLAKVEKASAVGNAKRSPTATVIARTEPVAAKDPVVSMIETAERNTLRNLSK